MDQLGVRVRWPQHVVAFPDDRPAFATPPWSTSRSATRQPCQLLGRGRWQTDRTAARDSKKVAAIPLHFAAQEAQSTRPWRACPVVGTQWARRTIRLAPAGSPTSLPTTSKPKSRTSTGASSFPSPGPSGSARSAAEIEERQASDVAQSQLLTDRLAKAESERRKLLDAYYGGAIDVPTLKTEQVRIGAAIDAAKESGEDDVLFEPSRHAPAPGQPSAGVKPALVDVRLPRDRP